VCDTDVFKISPKIDSDILLTLRVFSGIILQTRADFSYIFLGKTIFQNFFRGKFFSQHFWGENFPRNFPRKKCTKNRPLNSFLMLAKTMPFVTHI
jgi:hypothetical protein